MLENIEKPFIFKIDIDNDFEITKGSLLEFMGYRSESYPEVLDDCFEILFKNLSRHYKPQAGFCICKKVSAAGKGFICEDVFFSTGKIIAERLRRSEHLAFFILTAGAEMDEWSGKLFSEDNTLLGYIVDCAGSELAENLADKVQNKLEEICKAEGLFITNRYSPGYCGWDTKEQKKLFSFFPDNFCGVSLNESCLMNPIKSISGVIGLGKKVAKQEYQCSICGRKDCFKKTIKKAGKYE